jgi:putative ABC transport system permease protein
MLWDIAIKHLWRRKLRSLLTILGVATAIQLYLMISGIVTTYQQETQRQLGAFTGKIVVSQQMESYQGSTDFTASGSSLKAETAADLLSLEGINRESSSAMVFMPIARSIMPYMPPAVLAVGVEPGHEGTFLGGFALDAGRATLTDPDEVILGQNAAAYYQPKDGNAPVTAGQTIELQGRTFKVVGVLKSAPQLFGNAVIMPLSTAQDLYDRADTVSSVILTAARVEDAPTLKERILAGHPELSVSTQDDMIRNAMAVIDGMATFMDVIMKSIVVVAIVLITIVVVVAVMEQRREIGTLRAIGARRWRIFSMVAAESMVLSLLGAMLALPIAAFLVRWGMTEFNSLPGMLQVWAQTILIAAVVGIAASVLPAWQALRVDPLEALRYE